jgi:ATP-dependent Clp protease ATP-binding subunit ClpC
MPPFHWRLPALVSTLDDESLLARPLLLPGVSCYALSPQRLKTMLARRLADVLRQIEPGNLYRYRLAELPEVRTLTVEVPPLADDLLRRRTVELPLQYVVWRHGDEALIAYVPAVGIEVLADDERRLAELLEPQIKLALSRNRSSASLRGLAALDRFRKLQVRLLGLRVKLPTLKEAALRQESETEREKSLLKEIATNLVAAPLPRVYERDAEVRRLAELLTRRTPRSVLLVGRSGVGKTALVEQLARVRERSGLGQTPIWSTSGSRIVAGMTGFGMWQERCEKLIREASKTRALLHLGNLVELIEVGKGGGNLQGVAALLRPHLDRGALLAIVECTPEQLAVVEREDPQFLETFAQFELAPPTPEQTRAILQAVAGEHSNGAALSAASLATLDRLHRRWATYSAAPGRQLRFLRNLLDDRRRGDASVIGPSQVTAAFSHETGLPLLMLDDDVPLEPDATWNWFAERVIGQTEAVQQVVDLLAAVKAGLARGGKPIASLLFIGPTGVGKTEMAKSLAEFLYRDRGRMVRFDMSEYSHPAAIERLIGGAYSARGLLTQKVRDQPFTVVLLDEFEKAHPQFFDVLLQVLGEGRLTDGVGRVTDFTNAVVIMTSNLGAESYRRGGVGFAGESAAADFAERHFEREVKAFLRPEMFNRLDRIVPFAPLDRATIASIARRELNRVLTRDGLRSRNVDLAVDDGVIEHLAAGGVDPRYGARPLKRAIERELVAPLAEGLNRYTSELRLTCRAERSDTRVRVEVDARRAGSTGDPTRSAAGAIQLVVALRRHVQALQQSGIITRLRNEIERIRQEQRSREQRLKKRGLPVRYEFTPEQARLLGHEALLERVERLARDLFALEDNSLQRFYASEAIDPAEIDQQRAVLDGDFRRLLFDLPGIESRRGEWLTIAAFGESLNAVVELLSMYGDVCRKHGEAIHWFWLKMYRAEHDESLGTPSRPVKPPPGPRPILRLLARREVEDATEEKQEEAPRQKVIDVFDAGSAPFSAMPSDCIGIAMQLFGAQSVALLQTESGRHDFLRPGRGSEVCYVETLLDRLITYDPPRDIGRRGALSQLRLRRTYDLPEEQLRDELLRRTLPIRSRRVDEALHTALEECLSARLWELIEPWS